MSDQKFIAAPANGASAESEDVEVRMDDDLTDPTPPVMPVAMPVAMQADGGAEPVTAREDGATFTAPDQMIEAESTKTRRARPKKMSLRIPDDEVARPSERMPASMPMQEPTPISTPRPAISPSRIIEINSPAEHLSNDAPEAAADEAAAADDAIHDAPTRVDMSDGDAPDPSGDRLTPDPITTPSPKLAAANAADLAWEISSPNLISEPGAPAYAEAAPAQAATRRVVAPLDEIDPADRTQEILVAPAGAPAGAPAATPAASPLPEKTAADLSDDAVDVQVDADDSVPDRLSELPEIGADDLVSIESVPVRQPLIQKKRSVPPAAPPIPALAYQSGEHTAQTPSGATAIVEAAPALVIVPPTAPVSTAATATSVPPLTDKKRIKPWWEDLFNDDFIRTMAKISDKQIAREASFIEESLGVAQGSALLDLGCGTGLHAIELTKRGYQVVGYDLSLPMLARAADEAQERNQKINFVQGDMRELAFEEMFDGVYSWNTSFGFFDEEKNGQVVARVHRALKKGGQFLLDVVNRDYIIKQSPSLAWFEGDGCICMDEMQIDFITSRMRIKRTMMMDDGRSREIEYSMRIYSLHELGKLLHEHGFRVAEVSGRMATPGVFFGNESPRTLILAEKR